MSELGYLVFGIAVRRTWLERNTEEARGTSQWVHTVIWAIEARYIQTSLSIVFDA